MRRFFPHPWLSVLVTLVWLLLLNSVSLGGLVLGVILGVALPMATAVWWPDRPRPRNMRAFIAYIGLVMWDVAVANVVVAKIVLFKPNRQLKPAFIAIPLDLRAPEAITLLAGTITMTPGTVTAELSADGRSLLVHALDAPDPDAVRDEIKGRYEARIKELFE
jgi:multicomponent K+:H+ antiporter subunit E